MTELLDLAPYSLNKAEKQAALVPLLQALTQHHIAQSTAYAALVADSCETIPFLTVPLFKQFSLKSIPDEAVFKVLMSSGTTGQTPSRIYLDAETAKNQSRALVRIMQDWIGKQRLPFLIWDTSDVIQNRAAFTARGAGIQGLSFLGRQAVYAFNPDMSLNLPAIQAFFERHGQQPVLMFGFTFMVWKYGLKALAEAGVKYDFKQAVLIHSGGWKKLEDEAVSPEVFNQTAKKQLGQVRVHNFYGMVEQVGSIFVACEAGHFHCPNFADVLVRQPGSWEILPQGQAGVLQVLSILPKSYPGHSLLTEDRGRILGEDDCICGRKGKYFEVLGRLAQVEVRGCSDTFETNVNSGAVSE